MKMSETHVSQLSQALTESAHLLQADVAGYVAGGNTLKRFRWDALWLATKAKTLPANWMGEVYAYANDDHVDTALRHHFGHKS